MIVQLKRNSVKCLHIQLSYNNLRNLDFPLIKFSFWKHILNTENEND